MAEEKNRGGRPKGSENKDKPFKEALRMEMLLAAEGKECDAHKGSLRWNARKLLERGDTAAIKELADRLDGKPVNEAVEEDEGTIIEVVRLFRPAKVEKAEPSNSDASGSD